jgi:hypothetical protein
MLINALQGLIRSSSHSMGSTMFYIAASSRPELNDRIDLMIGLAPVASMAHFSSPVKTLASHVDVIQVTKCSQIKEKNRMKIKRLTISYYYGASSICVPRERRLSYPKRAGVAVFKNQPFANTRSKRCNSVRMSSSPLREPTDRISIP